jgi:cytoskeleton protein RodZ
MRSRCEPAVYLDSPGGRLYRESRKRVSGVTFFQRIKSPFAETVAADEARMQPRMRRVGDVLLERRGDLGLGLDEIGAMLRIKPAYLAALEQDRSDDLPGPAYAIGFIRAYADFLGLNTEQVLARFKAEALGVTTRPDLTLPVPLGERSLPGGAVVLVAFILALCGYGIWYYLSTEDRNRPERVAAVPTALQPPPAASVLAAPPIAVVPVEGAAPAVPAPNPVPAPSGTSAPASPSAGAGAAAAPPPAASSLPATAPQPVTALAPPAATPVPAKPAPTSLAQPAATLTQAQPAAAPPAPPATSVVPTAASKITIRALVDCWIQIRASDQSIVFSRILKSGEVYVVPSRQGLSMRTGNAGALEIAIDGKPVPSIGGIGMLRRDVALDPTELAGGTAVHG